MVSFNLEKGHKFSLNKGVKSVKIGLGWQAGQGFDLDACVFGLVHVNGQPRFYDGNASHAVFYANDALKQADRTLVTNDGSIKHYGDSRTGDADGDDEVVDLHFTKLPDAVAEIAVFVTIYDAIKRNQTFDGVRESYINITDLDTNEVLCTYKLRDEFASSRAVQVGSFLKQGNAWEFKAVGAGLPVELDQILNQYM